MNNKYSVACITLVRDKYKITHGTPARCTLQFVRRCYGLRGPADSIRKFDSKSNRTADSIQTQKTIRRSLTKPVSFVVDSQ